MSLWSRAKRALLGAPKVVTEPGALHKLSLVALLAWVGLGADGLSSSAYGPEEAFRTLGDHHGLAVFLAAATALTVLIISYGYSRIIEQFPSGGGGYVVASKILGGRAGVLAGAALLVDYVLTITISVAAGADAIFSFLPVALKKDELAFSFGGVVMLTVMNLRGIKESVSAIAPIFALFIVTHAILLAVAIGGHLPAMAGVTAETRNSIALSVAALGRFGVLKLLLRAYSFGGGTYTGIEAVSNGVGMMREPRVATAKRTMVLMASSLAITASGLLVSYLLFHTAPEPAKTMNAVLLQRVAGAWSLAGANVGHGFVAVTLLSEGALLFVAAQTGFVDGPRVMANMAIDSWLPHRFSALSERLTMRNGVLLMGIVAIAALLYTRGQVSKLVVMYSINVFLTFSLSNIAMTVFWVRRRATERDWAKHVPAHVLAAVLCVLILAVTVFEKFIEGGWVTLLFTMVVVFGCFLVKRHYDLVARAIRKLDEAMPSPDAGVEGTGVHGRVRVAGVGGPPDPREPVAILFVGGYGGLGRHALLTLLRMFPGHFKGVVFASVALVDSDVFKGVGELEALQQRTRDALTAYENFATALGLPCTSRFAVGTEVAVEAEKLATELVRAYPGALVVAGQIIFEEDTLWNRLLHNETAFVIQRRLQRKGIPMIVLPVQLELPNARRPRSASGPRRRVVRREAAPRLRSTFGPRH